MIPYITIGLALIVLLINLGLYTHPRSSRDKKNFSVMSSIFMVAFIVIALFEIKGVTHLTSPPVCDEITVNGVTYVVKNCKEESEE